MQRCLVAGIFKKEETKSNLSYGSRISSSSSVSKLLGLKAKRAALDQKIIFADTIKEQEKTLAKLKLQQELSETLAEEAAYQVALNAGYENNEDESLWKHHRQFFVRTKTFCFCFVSCDKFLSKCHAIFIT